MCDDSFAVFYKLFDWLKSMASFWKLRKFWILYFKHCHRPCQLIWKFQQYGIIKVKHVLFPNFQITKCKFTSKQIQGMGLFRYSWWLWRTGFIDTCLLGMTLFYLKVAPHRVEDPILCITIFYTFILKFLWKNYI